MEMVNFYRRINDFKEVLMNQISIAVVESSDGLPRENLELLNKKTQGVIVKGFNDMVSSLMSIEDQSKKTATTTPTRKTRKKTTSK